jgi:hypothetical protein
MKNLDAGKIRAAQRLFQVGIENGIFDIRPWSSAVFDMAKRLAGKHTLPLGTRTLDILQVASTLVWKVDTFFTFDTNQRKLAKAKGLVGS